MTSYQSLWNRFRKAVKIFADGTADERSVPNSKYHPEGGEVGGGGYKCWAEASRSRVDLDT